MCVMVVTSDLRECRRLVRTRVTFDPQAVDRWLDWYLDTCESKGKAGGYGIQGLGGAFVTSIQGSYSNVVGLPLHETWALLTAQGIPSHLTTGDLRNE